MNTIRRRDFLKYATAATVAAQIAPSQAVLGANERVVLGLMGAGGRAGYLGPAFANREDVELRYVCDADLRRADGLANTIENNTGVRPTVVQDFRRILDDPEVVGLISTTPDHWHALSTILACQAGKDVYVEKPTSHSIWESQKMVEAARKYERVVQVGAQSRSAAYCYGAFEYLRSNDFGDIHFVRVLNSKGRGPTGHFEDAEVPPAVDYDMWLGPAPMRPFNESHFHYRWHWMWAYSGGDIINDGIHQIDIARWMINKDVPNSVVSEGGKFAFDDDQECPTTQTATWKYDDMLMSFEQALYAPYMKKTPLEARDLDAVPDWRFSGTRIEIYGTKQIMYLSRHGGGWEAFDADLQSVKLGPGNFTAANAEHQQNFIDCIKSRNLPNGDIEKVHKSTLLSHYANIAYRTGQRLHIDPKTERFIDNDAANALFKRDYRDPWTIPEKV